VIDPDAPRMGSPSVPPPTKRWCVVFGNEDTGVGGAIRELCADSRVRINMAPGVDSLNIGVATGILLHWFAENDGRPGWLDERSSPQTAGASASAAAADDGSEQQDSRGTKRPWRVCMSPESGTSEGAEGARWNVSIEAPPDS
jgi:hypothetical protein